jgi:polysaccharide deacetylase family protein (PEP-CTERM system associated)
MNILTFDLEEWFHIKFDHDFLENDMISSFERRLELSVYRLLDLLDKHHQKATFFCLGYIAREYPEIVRDVFLRGHDIACHSDMHKLASKMTRNEFSKDLDNALESIFSITGESVNFYRAPAFSIGNKDTWIFDQLSEHGVKIDSSIFPVKRDFGGFSITEDFNEPFIINRNDKYIIKEFPINTYNVLNTNIVFSGGGYFRFYPYFLIKYMMKRSNYVMSYFHPRDIDENQPVLNDLGFLRNFKSYHGIRGAYNKIDMLLSDFHFVSLSEADSLIDWSNAKVLNLHD